MKKVTPVLLLTAMAAIIPLEALAQHRANTNGMTCGEARTIVRRSGAVVLSTGTYTYERFVKNRSYCELNQTVKRVYVSTRDDNRCNVGYKCVYFDYYSN